MAARRQENGQVLVKPKHYAFSVPGASSFSSCRALTIFVFLWGFFKCLVFSVTM